MTNPFAMSPSLALNNQNKEDSLELEDDMPINKGLGKMKPKTMKEMLNEK